MKAEATFETNLGSVRVLKGFCTVHRETVLVHRLASEQEVAAWWPGGSNNPRTTRSAWIRCFANLVAFLDRDSVARKAAQHTAKQKIVLDALADRPEVVSLVSDDARSLTVYPKSYVALVEVQARQFWLAILSDELARLEGKPSEKAATLYGQILSEQTYLHRVIAWIVCTPGVGLPFDEGMDAPAPPADYANLHPADFFAIAAAFQRVNVMRLAALDMTKKNESRPDFSVFFSYLADGAGVSAARVMRDRSLAGELASSSERARAMEEARKEADAKAKLKQQAGGRV